MNVCARKSRNFLGILGISLISLLFSHCKSTSPQNDSSPLVRGFLGGANAWPNVVAITENSRYVCTGILVKPNIVLTAAHCLVDKKIKGSPTLKNLNGFGVYVGAGDTYASNQEITPQYGVVAANFHDRYNFSREADTNIGLSPDLAYVVLDRPIQNIKPAKLLSPFDDIPVNQEGVKVSVVGFGPRDCTFSFESVSWNVSDPPGYKRTLSGTLEIDNERHKLFLQNPADKHLVCPGDSGSAAFVLLGNGELRLMGVLSQSYLNTQMVANGDGAMGIFEPTFDSIACWFAQHSGLNMVNGFCVVPPAPVRPGRDTFDVQNSCQSVAAPNTASRRSLSAGCFVRKITVPRVNLQKVLAPVVTY